MPLVAIAVGSNLGDRAAHIAWVTERLRSFVANLRISQTIETAPVDVPDEQPNYLNAVVVGETSLPAVDLIRHLAALEHEAGRTRASFRAARTVDLDLILYGDAVIDTPELTVPHPRFRERLFVLVPLAEVAPGMVDPITGQTVGKLLEALRTSNL